MFILHTALRRIHGIFFNFLLQSFVLLAGFGKVAARCWHHGKSASGLSQMQDPCSIPLGHISQVL